MPACDYDWPLDFCFQFCCLDCFFGSVLPTDLSLCESFDQNRNHLFGFRVPAEASGAIQLKPLLRYNRGRFDADSADSFFVPVEDYFSSVFS